ncbi:adenosine deaminase [Paucibacter sp. PLA-PC-4]|uniref:adenosine deaminase n=1 Tax=Paucibacter sp. PLA-PC-4 TaxID=2993655 RepID=UPI00224B7C7B|nr:adenosine deaminase [Paucibacter sp. PLA-PC-4]MCX2865675.1 adenosine deaminase [Paucibacter sp. PLA-PC-4]
MSALNFPTFSRAELFDVLRRAPKAELHMHIEGSLEPDLMFKLAQRNGIALRHGSVEALRAAYRFEDLQSFLDIYYAGAAVLLTQADFFDMAWAYFERAAADNIVHAELFFDPQTHTSRGVSMQDVMQGLHRAGVKAGLELGISVQWILCFLRHLSEADALATLREALPYREMISGVGLDSSELHNPPDKFARVFEQAAALGLHRVAHAGEEGPPAYIWSALRDLGAQRLDHGVRSTEDADLLSYLARERVPLTVCPLSNVKLRVFDRLADHNLPALLDAGLCVTINSDDPAYFGGYLNDNLLQTFEALPQLGVPQAYQLLRNSFEASFIDGQTRQRWMGELDRAFGLAS